MLKNNVHIHFWICLHQCLVCFGFKGILEEGGDPSFLTEDLAFAEVTLVDTDVRVLWTPRESERIISCNNPLS